MKPLIIIILSALAFYADYANAETPRQKHSFCAGFYSANAIGEMGTFSSTMSLLFTQEFSSDQKAAVGQFSRHSNAYKKMGGIDQEYYDQGGLAGGNIFMSGRTPLNGKDVGYSELNRFCKGLFRGSSR